MLAPQDADLLYAKASALNAGTIFNATSFDNDVKAVIEQLERRDPSHPYIKIRRGNFFSRPMPENWETLFYFPSWSEECGSLKGLMSSDLSQGRHVQIVRHCLTPTVAVVWEADKSVCEKIKRMRWTLDMAKTPHGFIAVHRLIMDCGESGILVNEGFLPHGLSNPPHAQDGYCLLHLLARAKLCFLILSKNEQVLRNELFRFPQALRGNLKALGEGLEGPDPNPTELLKTAGKWHADHTDLSTVQFGSSRYVVGDL